MTKLKKYRKLFAFLTIIALLFVKPDFASAAVQDPDVNIQSDLLAFTPYEDWNFTVRSYPEPVTLQMSYDTISLMAECEGDVTDVVTCHVIDLETGAYNSTFYFNANGNVTTFFHNFPAGRYRVYFTGDTDILKTYGCITFSKYVDDI